MTVVPDGTVVRRALEDFVGAPGASPRVADDPVNLPMVRHWCQAMVDFNPVYLDADVAQAVLGGDGFAAPPAMLQSWTHHDRRFDSPELGPDDGEERLARHLREVGYPAVVATECEQEYLRYLRPGDRLTYAATIESISDEKRTRLGRGFFITTRITYRDQAGESVGLLRFVTFRFRPAAADADDEGTSA
jgi:uncharacterized protein